MINSDYHDKSTFEIETVSHGMMIRGPNDWIFFTYEELELILKEYKKRKTLMVKR